MPRSFGTITLNTFQSANFVCSIFDFVCTLRLQNSAVTLRRGGGEAHKNVEKVDGRTVEVQNFARIFDYFKCKIHSLKSVTWDLPLLKGGQISERSEQTPCVKAPCPRQQSPTTTTTD